MTTMAAFFVMASEYRGVPLIKRRVTGQIGGNAAAYGNVGSGCFHLRFSLYLGGLWETGSFQMQVCRLGGLPLCLHPQGTARLAR